MYRLETWPTYFGENTWPVIAKITLFYIKISIVKLANMIATLWEKSIFYQQRLSANNIWSFLKSIIYSNFFISDNNISHQVKDLIMSTSYFLWYANLYFAFHKCLKGLLNLFTFFCNKYGWSFDIYKVHEQYLLLF